VATMDQMIDITRNEISIGSGHKQALSCQWPSSRKKGKKPVARAFYTDIETPIFLNTNWLLRSDPGNPTIALPNPREELALPLNGKKSKLTRNDLLRYFAGERLQLNEATLIGVLARFRKAVADWHGLLERSFLSPAMANRFLTLLETRAQRCLA
jgi:hypothetical protein